MECILLHNTFPSAKVFSFYIFTLLIFRKPIKTTINKNKTITFIGIHVPPFNSWLYLDSSRSFKCTKCSPMVWFVFTCVRSLIVFVLREYILKVHILVHSEHKLRQIWNTCIVPCIYWSITYFNKLLIFFFKRSLLSRFIYTYYIE